MNLNSKFLISDSKRQIWEDGLGKWQIRPDNGDQPVIHSTWLWIMSSCRYLDPWTIDRKTVDFLLVHSFWDTFKLYSSFLGGVKGMHTEFWLVKSAQGTNSQPVDVGVWNSNTHLNFNVMLHQDDLKIDTRKYIKDGFLIYLSYPFNTKFAPLSPPLEVYLWTLRLLQGNRETPLYSNFIRKLTLWCL